MILFKKSIWFKVRLSFFLILFFNFAFGKQHPPSSAIEQETKIYSKHWFGKLPLTKNKNNPLLVHDIFIISYNLEKKFPDWVAYHLSPALVWGKLKEKRKYIPDPLLLPSQSLNLKHYKGASKCDDKKTGYDKGHFAPVGSFKASPFAYQAQYLSNIAPQARKLNQGPWRRTEELVRSFVKKGNEIKILTGPLYGEKGNKTPPCWKSAQGVLTEIPTAYWKIIAFQHKSKIKVCSILIPQKIRNQKDQPKKYVVKLNQLEKKTGLNFLSDIKKPIIQNCNFLF